MLNQSTIVLPGKKKTNNVSQKSSLTDNVTSFTKMYSWFFSDIVESSDPTIPTKEQLTKIADFNKMLSQTKILGKKDPSRIIIPTGDGVAIGFADSSEKPLDLAIDLLRRIFKYNKSKKPKSKLYVRVGLDVGPVYKMKDFTKKENVWGPGIIMAKRVMDLAQHNQIFASNRIAEDTRKLSREYKKIFHPIGKYEIKHGEQIQIHNVYGTGFGNKNAPRKNKIINAKKTFEESLKSKTAFLFNEIFITLDVLDTKTMQTRHLWDWNLINVSDEPRDEIFYYIDGDLPKDFKDLNVKLYDEKKNELSIINQNVNKPTHKEFKVRLVNPIKPRQKKRHVLLQYDWEETNRFFEYRLPTPCKKFRYQFTIPNKVDTTIRILKIDKELGYKWIAEPPPTIKYLADKTVVEWTASNLDAHDTYKFEW